MYLFIEHTLFIYHDQRNLMLSEEIGRQWTHFTYFWWKIRRHKPTDFDAIKFNFVKKFFCRNAFHSCYIYERGDYFIIITPCIFHTSSFLSLVLTLSPKLTILFTRVKSSPLVAVTYINLANAISLFECWYGECLLVLLQAL